MKIQSVLLNINAWEKCFRKYENELINCGIQDMSNLLQPFETQMRTG